MAELVHQPDGNRATVSPGLLVSRIYIDKNKLLSWWSPHVLCSFCYISLACILISMGLLDQSWRSYFYNEVWFPVTQEMLLWFPGEKLWWSMERSTRSPSAQWQYPGRLQWWRLWCMTGNERCPRNLAMQWLCSTEVAHRRSSCGLLITLEWEGWYRWLRST